jgi:YD repeat-containing protein
MKKIILTALCFLVVYSGTSIAGKQQKKNKVKSTTIMQTVYENGKPLTYKESTETFDKYGKTTSLVEYARDGSVTHKETAVYDNNQNLIEETYFTAKSSKNYKKTYRYSVIKDKMPLVEEVEYNAAGNIVKKTAYTYNASGKKASETVTDANGNLVSKSLFLYNAKNQKTHKQTFNRANTLDSVKEWQYDYY